VLRRSDSQLGRIKVFSLEASGVKKVPRVGPFDLEPGVIGAFRASPLSELFRPGNLVNQKAGNNWAKGHYKAMRGNSFSRYFGVETSCNFFLCVFGPISSLNCRQKT
jgi:hypothetical protein